MHLIVTKKLKVTDIITLFRTLLKQGAFVANRICTYPMRKFLE